MSKRRDDLWLLPLQQRAPNHQLRLDLGDHKLKIPQMDFPGFH
jgi:hypothetical protein